MDNTAVVGGDVYTKVELCPLLPHLFNHNSTSIPGLSFITSDSNTSPLLTPIDTIKLLNESVSCNLVTYGCYCLMYLGKCLSW